MERNDLCPRLLLLLLLLVLLLLPSSAIAQDPAANSTQPEISADQAIGSHLPLRVRGLLIREMLALQDAMNRILDAMIRGQNQVVAEQAQSIHDSFILKREMTPEDRQGLLASVPEAFVTRDRAFHALGGQLADAARSGNRDEQLRLYGQLATACAECHALHARDRFPEFAQSQAESRAD